MQNKIFTSFLVGILILFLVPCSALAAQNRGFYLGANIGHGTTHLDRPSIATSFDRSGLVYGFLAGFNFNKYFALEAGFERMQNVKTKAVILDQNVFDTVEPHYIYAALKGVLPIKDSFALYAKLGAASFYGKENLPVINPQTLAIGVKTQSSSRIVVYTAVGANYFINKNWSLALEGATTMKKHITPRASVITFGVNYLF